MVRARLIAVGQVYGRLTVVDAYAAKQEPHWQSLVTCSCGNSVPFLVQNGNLLSGNTSSCGCYQLSRVSEANRIDGFHYSVNVWKRKFYTCWDNMQQRCSNEKNVYYHVYGGRGITVCEKWQTFAGFKEDLWPMYRRFILENRPRTKAAGPTIDRIDNDGHYCPENVRFISKSANTSKMHVDRRALTKSA